MAYDPVKFLRKKLWRESRKPVLDFRKQVRAFAEFSIEEADRLGQTSDFAREVAQQHFTEAFNKGRRNFTARCNRRARRLYD